MECVVRELGPQGATVRRIAARAGVSVGTVYRRFPNKAALMGAVQGRYLRRREDLMCATLGLGAGRVRSLARGLVARAERDTEMTRAFGRVPCPSGALPLRLAGLLHARVRRRGLAGELLALLVRAVLPSGGPRSGSPS